jgi:phosphatidylinositol glycan class O
MDEDNLIDQFVDAGKKLAFMGDATWVNLFPHQFNLSLPFPCFNVKDLDTVDDGIWEHLLPIVRRPEAWDVLIAHYLGVDHCGHSFGVDSPQMSQKLRQMDDQVAAVLNELVAGGGPGGPYENALLLVAGDHGQTLSGDHGGGSPEEVDSPLIAIDVAGLRRALQKQASDGGEQEDPIKHEALLAACRSNCTCGEDKKQCAPDLPQIDLVPTLAVMFGLPIPFGNLGSLSPELWSLAATRCALDINEDDGSSSPVDRALAKAVRSVFFQVYGYLSKYASHPRARFPSAPLEHLNEKYARTLALLENASCADERGVAAGLDFLAVANKVARHVWTQFGDGSMALGACIFLATIIWHALLVWWAVFEDAVHWDCVELSAVALLASGVVAQSLGLFSFFYLLSEGYAVSWILCGMTLVITVARCATCTGPQPYKNRWRIVTLGLTAIACVWAGGRLGLASHSGYGFWQRLTVHEPQDMVVAGSATDGKQSAFAWWDLRNRHADWTASASFLGEYTVPTILLVHTIRNSLSEMILPR